MPGGATGLQLRVGPSDGLRWVRTPILLRHPRQIMSAVADAPVAEFKAAATEDAGWRDALVTGPTIGSAFAAWIAANSYKDRAG